VLTLDARDRAVLSAVLSVGQASEVVEVTGASVQVETADAMLAAPVAGVGGGIGAGQGGGASEPARLRTCRSMAASLIGLNSLRF